MKPFTTLLPLFGSILFVGCALTTDRVRLEYQPIRSAQTVNGADGITVFVTVNDLRADKTRVSCKKNGFGMEMAPIIAEEDPAVTIKRAIESEFIARGFKIGADALVLINSDITRFWNDHKTGFFAGDAVADLNMTVVVKTGSGEKILFTKQIAAQGTETNTQLASGNNAKRALDKALSNGIGQLFEDQIFLNSILKAKNP